MTDWDALARKYGTMGKHHLPDDSPPGKDKMYPEHSAEERSARTSALTGKDMSRAIGIVPRATPPGGLPADIPRVDRDESGEPGRSLETSLAGRIVAILLFVVILTVLVVLLH